MRTCLASMRDAWLYIVWPVSLDMHCIGNKKMYLWYKPLISMSFSNNVHKRKMLAIKNSGMLHRGREKLVFNYRFKANIIII